MQARTSANGTVQRNEQRYAQELFTARKWTYMTFSVEAVELF